MLVEYKSDYQKIAMGLLSFVPDLKDTQRLISEMEWYQKEGSRRLFLWRSQETNDLVAVIGIEEEDAVVLMRHIAINPSYRNEKLSFKILDAVSEQFAPKKISGTLETVSLVTKWQQESARLKQDNSASPIKE